MEDTAKRIKARVLIGEAIAELQAANEASDNHVMARLMTAQDRIRHAIAAFWGVEPADHRSPMVMPVDAKHFMATGEVRAAR